MTDATDDLDKWEENQIDRHNYYCELFHKNIWITKDHKELNIKKMETSHIIRILNMYKNNQLQSKPKFYINKFKDILLKRGIICE